MHLIPFPINLSLEKQGVECQFASWHSLQYRCSLYWRVPVSRRKTSGNRYRQNLGRKTETSDRISNRFALLFFLFKFCC